MTSLWILIATALLLLVYLIAIMKKRDANMESESFRYNQRITRVLLILALISGIILPLIITINAYYASIPESLIIIPVIIGEILSGIIFGYFPLENPEYTVPLVPTQQYANGKLTPNRVIGVQEKQWAAEK
jgi:glucose uptake protein GlcU